MEDIVTNSIHSVEFKKPKRINIRAELQYAADPNNEVARRLESIMKPEHVRRNDRCPCGSGKKKKKCHAERPAPVRALRELGEMMRKKADAEAELARKAAYGFKSVPRVLDAAVDGTGTVIKLPVKGDCVATDSEPFEEAEVPGGEYEGGIVASSYHNEGENRDGS